MFSCCVKIAGYPSDLNLKTYAHDDLAKKSFNRIRTQAPGAPKRSTVQALPTWAHFTGLKVSNTSFLVVVQHLARPELSL